MLNDPMYPKPPRTYFIWRNEDVRWRGLLRRVRPAFMVPPKFGIAWIVMDDDSAWCAPIPLNLVIGAAVRLWWTMRRGVGRAAVERSYWRGWRDARAAAPATAEPTRTAEE